MIPSTLNNDLLMFSPVLIVALGSLVILLVDVWCNRPWPRAEASAAVIIGAIAACEWQGGRWAKGDTLFEGLVFADPFTRFFMVLILGGTLLSMLLGMERTKEEGIEAPGEYYVLILMSTVGAIIFVSAAELITLFVGLETMSMALYCLCGAALGIRRSAESALKYFLLGSFSSAFLLYGMALLYGATGSTSLPVIAHAAQHADTLFIYFSLALMLIGLLFKVGAVPFHFWCPDVYQGAPTPVTAYMACVVKAAAVGAFLRVLWTLFSHVFSAWSGALWMIAVLTMILGNLIALRQRSMKRMLAYSSIAHAGYITMALLAPASKYGGGQAILYYLVAYTFMTIGAFGVVHVVTARFSQGQHPDDIVRFNGLGHAQPFLGMLMTLFLLSLAGLPPGMAGLLGKFYIFNAAVKANFVGLAIIGVICSAISCYYYLRVVVVMYFMEEEPAGDAASISAGIVTTAVLFFCAAAVVMCGLFPSGLYHTAAQAMAGF